VSQSDEELLPSGPGDLAAQKLSPHFSAPHDLALQGKGNKALGKAWLPQGVAQKEFPQLFPCELHPAALNQFADPGT
jgi:hypothetical protein